MCRMKMKSRRECRPDNAFNELIKAIYDDVEQVNEEALRKTQEGNKSFHSRFQELQSAEVRQQKKTVG